MRETIVTFTHYITDFFLSEFIPNLQFYSEFISYHTVQEGKHTLASWNCHPQAEVAYVGKVLILPSALLSALFLLPFIIFHLSFPLAKRQLSGCSPAWEGKPMARSWGWGALGPPQDVPCCLLTQTLKIWVGFLRDEASQH